MRTTKIVEKTAEVEETTDIICNLCGESCSLGPRYDDGNPPCSYGGLIETTISGGYNSTPGNGSGALDDMTRYTFSLCEFCLDWLFEHFTVPVAVDDPMNDYLVQDHETLDEALEKRGIVQLCEREQPPAWRPATQRVVEDNWRQQKEKFFLEASRRAAKRASSKLSK